MKQLFIATTLLTTLVAFATAPTGPRTTVVYYAPDLRTQAAEVILSPRFTTIIRTWDAVEDLYYGDQNHFEVKRRDDLLVLWPKARSGTTDLVVFVAGETLKFVVRIDDKERQPREYVIKKQLPYFYRSHDPTVKPSSRPGHRKVATTAPNPKPMPGPRKKLPVRTQVKRPGAVEFAGVSLEATVKLLAPSEASVLVALSNNGLYPVRIDPSKVEVRQGGALREFLLVRTPPAVEIPPHRGVTLTFQVRGLKAAPFSVGFEVFAVKDGLPYWVELEVFPTETLSPVKRIAVSVR